MAGPVRSGSCSTKYVTEKLLHEHGVYLMFYVSRLIKKNKSVELSRSNEAQIICVWLLRGDSCYAFFQEIE